MPEAKFGDDLDADSLDLVELVMALEEEFDVEVPRRSSRASRPSARPTTWSSQALMDGRGPARRHHRLRGRRPVRHRARKRSGTGSSARASPAARAIDDRRLGPARRTSTAPRRPAAPTASSSSPSPPPPRRSSRPAGPTADARPHRHDLRHRRRRSAAPLEEQIDVCLEKGERRVSPFLVPMMMANAAGAAISMRYGLQGPNETIMHRLRGSHPRHRLRRPAHRLGPLRRRGHRRHRGGRHCHVGVAGFGNMTALSIVRRRARRSTSTRDGFVHRRGRRPCSCSRSGTPPSPAAPRSTARCSARRATPTPTTSPRPRPAARVRSPAWSWRWPTPGCGPATSRQINAHGTSTPLNDAAEAEAIAKVFGPPGSPSRRPRASPATRSAPPARSRRPPCCCRCEHALIPPTAGTTRSTRTSTIDLVVGEARPWTPGPTMSNNFGFGGHNGSIIIGPADGGSPRSTTVV